MVDQANWSRLDTRDYLWGCGWILSLAYHWQREVDRGAAAAHSTRWQLRSSKCLHRFCELHPHLSLTVTGHMSESSGIDAISTHFMTSQSKLSVKLHGPFQWWTPDHELLERPEHMILPIRCRDLGVRPSNLLSTYSAVDSIISRSSLPSATMRHQSYSAIRSVRGSTRLTRRRMACSSRVHEWRLLEVVIRHAIKDGKWSTYRERDILLVSCTFSSSSAVMCRFKVVVDSLVRTGSIAWAGMEGLAIVRKSWLVLVLSSLNNYKVFLHRWSTRSGWFILEEPHQDLFEAPFADLLPMKGLQTCVTLPWCWKLTYGFQGKRQKETKKEHTVLWRLTLGSRRPISRISKGQQQDWAKHGWAQE